MEYVDDVRQVEQDDDGDGNVEAEATSVHYRWEFVEDAASRFDQDATAGWKSKLCFIQTPTPRITKRPAEEH